MSREPVIITVRTASTRLPRKCLLPFGNGNVLEHVIRRTVYFDLEPFVATTVEPTDDVVGQICEREGERHLLDKHDALVPVVVLVLLEQSLDQLDEHGALVGNVGCPAESERQFVTSRNTRAQKTYCVYSTYHTW